MMIVRHVGSFKSRGIVTTCSAKKQFSGDSTNRRQKYAPNLPSYQNARKSFVTVTKAAKPEPIPIAAAAEATYDFVSSPMFLAAVKAAYLIASLWILTFLILFLLRRNVRHSWEVTWEEELRPGEHNVASEWATFVRALYSPLLIFLPVWVAIRSTVIALKTLDVIFHTAKKERFRLWKWLHQWLHQVCSNLVAVEKLMDKVVWVMIAVCGIWFIARLKDEFVERIIDIQYKKDPIYAGELKRTILPISSIVGYLLVGVAGVSVLAILGINIRPILTSFGIGSLVVGVASQSVLGDLISGLNIFVSRPFVVGDRIRLYLIRQTVYGIVERVTPLRTIVRDDFQVQIIIPNKVINQEVLHNESRPNSHMRSILSPGGQKLELQIQLTGFDLSASYKKIAQKTENMLAKKDSLQSEYPIRATIVDINPQGAIMEVQAFTNRQHMKCPFADLKQEILLHIQDIIDQEKTLQKEGVVSFDGTKSK